MNFSKAMLMTATTLLFFAANVQAESIRCGEFVIEDGDLDNAPTMEEVIQKCGPPSSSDLQSLYYKEQGKRLDFNAEGQLISINEIEDE